MNKRNLSFPLLLLCACLLTSSVTAQQKCQPPTPPTLTSAQNIFNEQQEMDLGDAVAEHVQRDHRVIDDEALTQYLRRIGERLTKHLPPTTLRFQFFLFDVNDVNAFTLPGGRIYVSRKMVAFAKNEDELAGVIAHELGHIVARHSAIDTTALFREVLGVTQVTDRRDIFARYNELIENAARKPKAFSKLDDHEAGNQNIADLIGLYAMARAGYDPQAQAALWDRYHELKGKTGGFLADLFGRTKPEQKRLREMLKGLASLPADCVGPQLTANAEDFRQWQTAVVSYTGTGRKESIRGLSMKKALNPALRSDINHLRFSLDGKYVLAQDDSGINVLSRQPFASLFRIPAVDARPAQFTPDSRQVVFHTTNMRVEMWDIAEQKLNSAREVVVRKACVQTLLSPDGNTLACLDGEFGLNLIDIQSGAPIYEKKTFTHIGFYDLFFMLLASIVDPNADTEEREFINMSFSPDSHYFLAGDRSLSANALGWTTDVQSVVYDLTAKTTVSMKGDFKNVLSSGFAFVGGDKIIGKNHENAKKAGIYSFPAGQPIETFEMRDPGLKSVTAGNYVLLRNFGKLSGGIMDLSSKKVFHVNQRPILDGYEGTVASERRNGELGLYELGAAVQPAVVSLPQGEFGRLYAADVTPDFKWLAVSGYSRGGVWNLSEGKMAFYVRGFRGVHIDDAGVVYADFPSLDQTPRNIARLHTDTKDILTGPPLSDRNIYQVGSYLMRFTPVKEDGSSWENVNMEVRNARDMSVLWSTTFPKERPWFWVIPSEQTITLLWTARSKAAAAELKENPTLQKQMAALKEKEGDYLVKTLDLRTGKVLGAILVETGKGSFRIREVFTSGNRVVVADTQNRVLVYSLTDGQQVGKVFGKRPVVSSAANVVGVEADEGVLVLYDLNNFEKREQYTFSSSLAFARFSPDGKQLFVLTANQNVYLLNLAAAGTQPAD